jgi:hypothetical protein
MKELMMIAKSAILFTIVLGLASPLLAQEREDQQTKQAEKKPSAEPQPPGIPPPVDRGQAVNVRIDVTITDQQSATQPATKTLSLLAADNSFSRVRSEGVAWTTGGQYGISLRIDARPRLITPAGDKIHLEMVVEYKPTAPEPKPGNSATTLTESFDVVLENTKPLVITQAADPNSDRKVKLEVKATILR